MGLLTSWPLFAVALFLVLQGSGCAPHAPQVSHLSSAPHASQFSSHVSFATPARSFSHGVGAAHAPSPHSRTLHGNFRQKLPTRLRLNGYRSLQGLPDETTTHFRNEDVFEGYPRERPSIPFQHFTYPRESSLSQHPHVTFGDNCLNHVDNYNVPLLPPSPYRVDSPDAESLWPEGLFTPPTVPLRTIHNKEGPHITNFLGYSEQSGNNIYDPYFLDGLDAVRAFARIKAHGELFHHEIPHIRALLANQQLRLSNGLQPNRLGSIRPKSPWHRL